jgi:hypothetical protein
LFYIQFSNELLRCGTLIHIWDKNENHGSLQGIGKSNIHLKSVIHAGAQVEQKNVDFFFDRLEPN